MVCLDSCFIIDILRNNKEAILIKERIEKSSEALTIASPTIIELMRGLESINIRKGEKEEIDDFIRSVTTLSLDKKSAIKAGNIELELIRNGQRVEIEDIMIAAISITNNEKLVTNNEKHFSRIRELEIESY